MPFQLSLEMDGDVLLSRRLEDMIHRTTDMSPAFELMHRSFLSNQKKQFKTEGRSGSLGWRPLKPATVAHKARKGLRPEILRATNRLMKSTTMKSSSEHIKQVGRREAFFGTAVPYAGPHQNPKPSSSLPRRRVVEMTERQRRAWVRMAQEHLVGERRSVLGIE